MGYANVITRHEDIADELRAAPGYYVCTGMRRHMYNDVTVPSDRICIRGDRTAIVQIIVR